MSDCVLAAGRPSSSGYGRIMINYKSWLAHRWVWTQHYGPIPDGMFVLHRCDNRMCINIEHLFLGTATDNSSDMVSKDRSLKGSRQPNAKLSETDVVHIRASNKRQQDLADEFGVHNGLISMIKNRKRWKHI